MHEQLIAEIYANETDWDASGKAWLRANAADLSVQALDHAALLGYGNAMRRLCCCLAIANLVRGAGQLIALRESFAGKYDR